MISARVAVAAAALAISVAVGACSNGSSNPADAGGGADGPADAVATDGSSDSALDSPGDAETEAGCDDDAGAALVCSDAGTAPCSLADDQCPMLAAHLKPRIANAMYSCTANSGCMSGDFAMCITQTFAASCPDPSAATPCMTIVATCPDAGSITEADCEAQLSPMTPSGRNAVVACIAGDGGTCNLALCVQLAL
jgi:hypothetical protein